MGMLVETTSDSGPAMEAYYKAAMELKPCDVVMLRLKVTGGPGGVFAVQKILRIHSDAAVICTSGYADNPVMSDFGKFGFKGAIAKPYTFDQLKAVVQRVLEAPSTSDRSATMSRSDQ